MMGTGGKPEYRSGDQYRSGLMSAGPDKGRERTIRGYAAVFDTPADIGPFVEVIRPGAFRESLRRADVVALMGHDVNRVLGRVGNGTLRLREDATGLAFELDLPDNTEGNDLLTSIKRGDITGMSFGFSVPKDGERISYRDGTKHRELVRVNLGEVSVTAFPAYGETSVGVKRELTPADQQRLRMMMRVRVAQMEF